MVSEKITHRKLFSILGIVVVVFGSITLISKYLNKEERSALTSDNIQVAEHKTPDPDSNLQDTLVSFLKDHRVADVTTLAGTPAEAELLEKWRESKGRFSTDSMMEYSSYDIQTLIDLSNSGDVKAMMAAASFFISEKYTGSNGLENAMEILKRAAVYGSTGALQDYADLYQVKNYKPDSVLEKKDMIELLAWKNVAALRGDLWPNYSAKFDIAEQKFHLDKETAKNIQMRSEEIYSELQQERIDLGLGDFDNSQSAEAKKFFNQFEYYMDQYKE